MTFHTYHIDQFFILIPLSLLISCISSEGMTIIAKSSIDQTIFMPESDMNGLNHIQKQYDLNVLSDIQILSDMQALSDIQILSDMQALSDIQILSDMQALSDMQIISDMQALSDLQVSSCTTSACPPHSQCIQQEQGYLCACLSGFELQEGICRDIDECRTGLAICDEIQSCRNSEGSYHCDCPPGSIQNTTNPMLCEPINPCQCPSQQICINQGEGQICQECDTGYQVINNECVRLTCMTSQNPCDPNFDCLDNMHGGFDCIPSSCGNGIPDEGEACDDHNRTNFDGCSIFCSIE